MNASKLGVFNVHDMFNTYVTKKCYGVQRIQMIKYLRDPLICDLVLFMALLCLIVMVSVDHWKALVWRNGSH